MLYNSTFNLMYQIDYLNQYLKRGKCAHVHHLQKSKSLHLNSKTVTHIEKVIDRCGWTWRWTL